MGIFDPGWRRIFRFTTSPTISPRFVAVDSANYANTFQVWFHTFPSHSNPAPTPIVSNKKSIIRICFPLMRPGHTIHELGVEIECFHIRWSSSGSFQFKSYQPTILPHPMMESGKSLCPLRFIQYLCPASTGAVAPPLHTTGRGAVTAWYTL